jgi:hypothetical protein
MPRTLFWLLYIHCTCIAYGTHQTSTKSLLNLNICPSVALRLVSQHRRNQCQVSVVRRQLALCPSLLRTAYQPGAFLGVQWDKNHWALYCQPELWLVTVLRINQFAKDTYMVQAIISYRNLTPISYMRTQAWVPQWDKHLNFSGHYMEVWCVPCAVTMPCIYIEVGIKFPASYGLLPHFLKSFVREDQSKFFLIKYD